MLVNDMSQFARSSVTAVLGPTNTGKTHLAVERMCGHASGMIGFPLRLLAREVYDRVVRMKGVESVGLITGEEKILPPKRNGCCALPRACRWSEKWRSSASTKRNWAPTPSAAMS